MKLRHFITIIAAAIALLAISPAGKAADFPKGSPAFKTNYAEALKAAEVSGKPLIVIFSASWCGPCQANKKRVYPAAEVKLYHDKFVWAYLDADDEANIPAMQKFEVSGIPHIEFLDKTGESLGHMAGGTSPEVFAQVLAEVSKLSTQ